MCVFVVQAPHGDNPYGKDFYDTFKDDDDKVGACWVVVRVVPLLFDSRRLLLCAAGLSLARHYMLPSRRT